jgi:hypothetical protein
MIIDVNKTDQTVRKLELIRAAGRLSVSMIAFRVHLHIFENMFVREWTCSCTAS